MSCPLANWLAEGQVEGETVSMLHTGLRTVPQKNIDFTGFP